MLQAGMYLEQFKASSDNTFKFRCPLCGDSKKSKTLCRGYIYEHEGHYEFKCHNCGRCNRRIGDFFSQINAELYAAYRREVLLMKYDKPKNTKRPRKASGSDYTPDDSPLKGLARISSLPEDHDARKYIEGRKLPAVNQHRLYYCPDFTNWANKLIPNKYDARIQEERILIPLYDEDRTFRGVQGRSLNPYVKNQLRYLTVLLDKTRPVLYNAEHVDFTRKYFVFEGPFDSMFVGNGCATLTATSNYPFKNNNNLVRVLDNQPRNKEVIKQYQKCIDAGEKIVIWPLKSDGKDINQMVKDGQLNSIDVEKFLDDNTFSGLNAQLRFNKWKKI